MSKEGFLENLNCLDQVKIEPGFKEHKVQLGNFINTSVEPSAALVLKDDGNLPFARLKEVGIGLNNQASIGLGLLDVVLDVTNQTVEIQDDTLACRVKSGQAKMVEYDPKTKNPRIIKTTEAALLGALCLVSPKIRKFIAQKGLVILRETLSCQFNLIGKGILVPRKFEDLPDEEKIMAELDLVTARPHLIHALNDKDYNPFAIVVRL